MNKYVVLEKSKIYHYLVGGATLCGALYSEYIDQVFKSRPKGCRVCKRCQQRLKHLKRVWRSGKHVLEPGDFVLHDWSNGKNPLLVVAELLRIDNISAVIRDCPMIPCGKGRVHQVPITELRLLHKKEA